MLGPVLDDEEILLARLAMGRSWLAREDALRLAERVRASGRVGRRERLGSTAVRLGFLERRQVDELERVLAQGALICRGTCGQRLPLRSLPAASARQCGRCGGPLYVARALDAVVAAEEPADPELQGSRTLLELDVAGLVGASATSAAPTSPAPAPAPGPPPSDEATLEFDAPPVSGPPSRGAAEADDDEDELVDADRTWTTSPAQGEEFVPFRLGQGLEVLAPIGKGGMGSVYRARAADGRTLAVKILTARAAPDVIARFTREVQLSASLAHPNIVRVHLTGVVEQGPDAGKPYFAMDYVAGRDLAAWAAERRRTPAECVAMVAVLCAAMEHAHARGVVHRDIKPANVLVARDGDRPVLCDFGLARYRAEVQDLTKTGDILGTPSYMPPEQAMGKRHLIGPPTDVYALGAVLYHLLTGHPPFLGASAFLTIAKVMREPPEPPSRSNPEVTPALEAAVLKALAKNPVERFPTCGDLRAAIEAAVGARA